MSKSYAFVCWGRSFLPSLFKGHICMKMGHWIVLRMPFSSTLATSPTIFSFLRHKTKILGPLSHINQEKTKAKFQTWIVFPCFLWKLCTLQNCGRSSYFAMIFGNNGGQWWWNERLTLAMSYSKAKCLKKLQ